MKILQDSNELAKSLFDRQIIEKNKIYRFMKYSVKIKTQTDEILLYNNLSKELVLLSKEESVDIDNVEFNFITPTIQTLIERYFLVPQDFDEKNLANQLRNVARLMVRMNGITNYTILPTTACNARCFYCFEAGTPIFTMSASVANDVADYIIKNHDPNKPVSIRWFGGEPLCNREAIDIICERLRNNNVNLRSEIVSNGYLFEKKLIDKAIKDWKLKSVQITIDGMPDTYNKVKNYKNGDMNAFVRVSDNIELLCQKGINVTIRLNMDKHNDKELFTLVDWISNRYVGYDNLFVYARVLFEDIEKNNISRSSEERIAITNKFIELQNKIKKLGLSKAQSIDNHIKVNACSADNEKAVLISPQGNLGRCEHHVNDDFYGTIYDDKAKYIWNDYCASVEKCDNCVAYPSCIRLKRCHLGRDECYDYEQYTRVSLIKNGIEMIYKSYLENSK